MGVLHVNVNVMETVAEWSWRTYPAPLGAGGVGSIPANPDALNVPSFRRRRFEMKLSPFFFAGAGGLGSAGLNIQAYSLSDAKNYKLDKTSSTGQFILRNSFNYLSYVSTVQNTNIACLIIDYF